MLKKKTKLCIFLVIRKKNSIEALIIEELKIILEEFKRAGKCIEMEYIINYSCNIYVPNVKNYQEVAMKLNCLHPPNSKS